VSNPQLGATEPIGPATQPCTGCGSAEPPDARGLCATKTCRRFRVGNGAASIHDGRAKLTADDLATRDDIISQLLAERPRQDVVSRLRLVDYATASVQLQKVSRKLEEQGPVTSAGRQRALVGVYTAFSQRVERLGTDLALSAEAADGLVKRLSVGVSSMPSPMLQLAHTLLSRSINGEALTDRELGQLDILRTAMRGDVTLFAESDVDASE
jgi:hypothetical protein